MSVEFVEVASQAELDAAVKAGNVPVCRSGFFMAYGSATVRATGSATVRATGSATVRAFDSATVRAYDSATVRAFGSATVRAFDSATVRATGSATVRASDSATVQAYGSATVEAYGSATVRAFGSATVVRAYDSATVRAFDSATVRAFDSATVRAFDSATVEAYGSATVWAFGSATVEATPLVAIHRHIAPYSNPKVRGGVLIEVRTPTTAQEFIDFYGIKTARGWATVYKLVGNDLKSRHGSLYEPGKQTTCPDWNPEPSCGNGLHFAPRPFMAHKYGTGSRYLECRVKVADMVVINGNKCKTPACEVVREVDEDGEPMEREARDV